MNEDRLAEWIGIGIRDILDRPGNLQLFGDTSKGVFFKHPSGRIIFLSRESARGPLTINLADHALPSIPDNSTATLTSDALTIQQEIRVNLRGVRVWEPTPTVVNTPSKVSLEIIRALRLRAVLEHKTESLLNRLSLLPGDPDLSSSADAVLVKRFQPVYKNLGVGSIEQQLDSLMQVIGYGRGLTPGGDDVLAGIFLGLTRYKMQTNALPSVEALRESIIPFAYQYTTQVSANILEYAIQGQADERIIAGLDAFLAPSIKIADIERNLFKWGNTSGLDTLAGLVVLAKSVGLLQ